jgi:hypothetical protein
MWGAFSDGVGPALGATDVTVVGAGAGSTVTGPGGGGGVLVQPGLGARTSLALGAGAFLTDYDEFPLPIWSLQLRRRLEADLEGPNHLTWFVGTGGLLYPAGFHVAVVGARDFGRWRLYGGGGAQVAWLYGIGAFGLTTGGLSWNPPGRLSVGLEGTAVFGVDTGQGPFSDASGEVSLPVTGVASLYLRVRAGNERRPEPPPADDRGR